MNINQISYKELFIIEKTSSLLEQGLKNRLEAYKEKHNRLESAIKPDFNDFLNHRKNCIDSYINSEITKQFMEIKNLKTSLIILI